MAQKEEKKETKKNKLLSLKQFYQKKNGGKIVTENLIKKYFIIHHDEDFPNDLEIRAVSYHEIKINRHKKIKNKDTEANNMKCMNLMVDSVDTYTEKINTPIKYIKKD